MLLLLVSFKTTSQSVDLNLPSDQSNDSILNQIQHPNSTSPANFEAPNHDDVRGINANSTPDRRATSVTESTDLQRLVEKVEFRLNSNEDAHLYLDDSLTVIENELKRLTKLVNEQILTNLNALKSQIDALDSNLLKKAQLSESMSKSNTKKPPFRLISIDQWETEWSAVLTLDGHVTMIYPNDTRAGWTLLKVNPLARSATFLKRSTGLETTLFVTE